MKNLLLLIVSLLATVNIYAQDCPATLVCINEMTVSISEQNNVSVTELLENGNEYEQCNMDSVFLGFSISTSSNEFIRETKESQNIDCSFTTGTYLYTVTRLEISADGTLDEGVSCFGELILIDKNNICAGLSAGFDINVILDCTTTDLVGVAGVAVSAEEGESVCVPFYAKNFTEMLSVQTGFTWNPKVLSYAGFESESLIDYEINEGDADEGIARLSWSPANGEQTVSVSDNEVIFKLCFDVIGNEAEYSKVSMVDVGGLEIEFGRDNGPISIVDYCVNPGLVNVIGNVQVGSSYAATINGEELSINPFDILAIERGQIKTGKNTIEFTNNNFEEYLNGVSTLDLVMGIKMLVLDDPIVPIEAIALDVDYSGGINVKDLVLMRNLILGRRQDLPHPGKFFLKHDHAFGDDFDEFDYGYFNAITFDAESNNQGQLFIKAYNYGDLNGSSNLQTEEVEVRSSAEKLSFTNKYMRVGDIAKIKFSIDSRGDYRINGFQSSIQFEDIEILGVGHAYFESEFLTYSPDKESLNVLFASTESKEALEFTVELKALRNGFLSDMISLSNEVQDELVKSDLTTSGIELAMNEPVSADFKISPNPFDEQTIITIPKEYIGGKLIVNDILGKKISEIIIVNDKVIMTRSDLYNTGVYLVSLKLGNRTATKRIVLN